MIHTVHTSNVVYHSSKNENENNSSHKIHLYNCAFRQTSYGSILIERDIHPYINELYPSQIESVVHVK